MRQAHELSEAEFWEEVRRQLADRPDSMPTVDIAEEAEQRSPELAAATARIRGILARMPGVFADAPRGVQKAIADAQAEYRALLRQLAERPLAAGYALRENRPGSPVIDMAAVSDQVASTRVREMLADRPAQSRTFWPSATVWRTDSEGGQIPATAWTVLVAVDPEPPPCPGRREHEWPQRPGLGEPDVEGVRVYESGGGLLIIRTCPHCGCTQNADTWATDPLTGEQGLTSVSYAAGFDGEAGSHS